MSLSFSQHLTVQQEVPQWVALPRVEYCRSLACFTARLFTTIQATLPLPLWESCTLMSYFTAFWATMHSTKLRSTLWATLHTAKLYAAPYWATLHPTELHCNVFFSSAVPSELHCTLWAMMQPAELPSPTLLSCSILNYAAPSEQCCTLLSHGALFWATLHLPELRFTTKLRCALLS
jgi:hypothetical protein